MEENNNLKMGANFYRPPYPTYLCGPMFGRTHEEMSGWRNYVKSNLSDCIDPVCTEMDKTDPTITVNQDLTDISRCNFLIVNYDNKSPAVGSSMEMFFALNNVSPSRFIFVVTDEENYSAWLTYHSDKIFKADGFKGYDEAIKHINQIKDVMETLHNQSEIAQDNIADILRKN